MTDIISWGDVGLVGLPLLVLIFIAVLYIRGDLVSRKQVDAIQKVADTFREAWEVSERNKETLADAVRGQSEVDQRLLAGQETMIRLIKSSPKVPEDGDLT